MAVSMLRKILVATKLVGLYESLAMDYEDLWGRITAILRGRDVQHVVALVRERLFETLVQLLVDLAPLNQVNSARVDTHEVCEKSDS